MLEEEIEGASVAVDDGRSGDAGDGVFSIEGVGAVPVQGGRTGGEADVDVDAGDVADVEAQSGTGLRAVDREGGDGVAGGRAYSQRC